MLVLPDALDLHTAPDTEGLLANMKVFRQVEPDDLALGVNYRFLDDFSFELLLFHVNHLSALKFHPVEVFE